MVAGRRRDTEDVMVTAFGSGIGGAVQGKLHETGGQGNVGFRGAEEEQWIGLDTQ